MKKVRMNVSIVASNFSYYPGEEVELDDKLAEIWHEVGHCTILEEPPKKRGVKNENNTN